MRSSLYFFLEKPMQVYTPIIRALVSDNAVDTHVVYFPKSNEELIPMDRETRTASAWGREMLEGYTFETRTGTFSDGFSAAARLRNRLKCLIILQGTRPSFCRGAIAACVLFRIPFLIRYDAALKYNSPTGVRGAAKSALLPMLLARTTYLGYTGTWTREYLARYRAKPAQLFHFPYVIDNEWFRRQFVAALPNRLAHRQRLGIPAEAPVFLSVVKFAARENPVDVADAFCNERGAGAHLVLVGDGPLRSAVEAARNRSVRPGRIHLTGYVKYSDLPAMYAVADAFIHPANDEVWGVSVNEALECGLPVIASDNVGAAADLVTHGLNGLIYPCGSVPLLATAIDDIATNISRWRAEHDRCRAAVFNVTPRKVADSLIALAGNRKEKI